MTTASTGHRIRLRGPWKLAWIDEGQTVPGEVETRKHPEEWPAFIGSRAGRVQLSRIFHAPTNLDDTEALFIVLTGVRGSGEVRVNGERIGTFTEENSAWEFPVPLPLPFANEVTITVSFAAATPEEPNVGVYDAVALEIRSGAEDVMRGLSQSKPGFSSGKPGFIPSQRKPG